MCIYIKLKEHSGEEMLFMVGAAGFEPATPWSQTRCANRTAPRPEFIIIFDAVRAGFEPAVPLQVRQFSKLVV